MEKFIERIIDEKNELDAKISKLEVFMMKDDFKKIDKIHQSILSIQLSSMQTYSQCLHERLKMLS